MGTTLLGHLDDQPKLGRDAPQVSVIMATYNGSAHLRKAVGCLLAQTLRDIEIIIVDDGSTDDTPAILAAFDDARLRIVRNPANLGVVKSRNIAFAMARGIYVAMQDHDDLSLPTRLAKQVAYLDSHPGTVLVGTAAHTTENGRLGPARHAGHTTPALIGWLMLVANPLICSSIMFRGEAARALGELMRADYTYADDYDLYFRLMRHGEAARLDEPLVIYRLHEANASRRHEDIMVANAARVLAPAYREWLAGDTTQSATMVATYFAACKPVGDLATLAGLRAILREITETYLARMRVDAQDEAAIRHEARALYARTVRNATLHAGLVVGGELLTLDRHARSGAWLRERTAKAAYSLPMQDRLRGWARALRDRPRPVRHEAKSIGGTDYRPARIDEGEPPALFVVVDTEAEFDWSQPFERRQTGVGAIQHLERGQAIFDRYGLKPIYVVDYPVATTPASVARLSAILARGACEIGAHLHPWTTPPYDESLTSRNSYPGNLPCELEEAKLTTLIDAIEDSFGFRPVIYKAGRYGFGPNTSEILARAGIELDLSVMPMSDLSADGGPCFSALQPAPYWLGDTGILTIPMTRSRIGAAPWMGVAAQKLLPKIARRTLPIVGLLARTRLSDMVTLTPEGVTAQEQIRLIDALLARGTRHFVLHYHSPSLEAGHTSYTRTEAELAVFLTRIETVCRYFFEEVGGMTGQWSDLLPERKPVSHAYPDSGKAMLSSDLPSASMPSTISTPPATIISTAATP